MKTDLGLLALTIAPLGFRTLKLIRIEKLNNDNNYIIKWRHLKSTSLLSNLVLKRKSKKSQVEGENI